MEMRAQPLVWYDDNNDRHVSYTTITNIRNIDGHLEGEAVDPRTHRVDYVGRDDDTGEWQFV